MKKTLSMLLALVMVVALVAIPASAAEATTTAKVSVQFDLSAFEPGTVLTSEALAGNPVLKYAGIAGPNAGHVTYTKTTETTDETTGETVTETSEKTLLHYNALKFDTSVSESDDGNTMVSVEEFEGENVIRIKASNTSTAGIAFAPLSAGSLADGKTARVSFEFYQPVTNQAGRIALGLALDNGEGLDYLEINEPTDTSWDKVRSGATQSTRFVDNAEVGYLSLTFNQFGYSSPALFFSRTTSAGEFSGTNGWSMGSVNNASNATYADTADARKSAMDKWYKVTYEMTKKAGGIWVRIYSNDVDASALQYTEYLYPLTDAELADFDDSKLCVVLTDNNVYTSQGEFYVKNISGYTDITVPAATYSTRNITESSFEDMDLGVRPTANDMYAGASAGAGHTCISYHGDSKLTETQNTLVALNPATDKGNESGKVLKIFSPKLSANDNKWFGFHTSPFTVAQLKSEEGVTIQYDMYTEGNFNNGRFVITGANADGTEVLVIAQDSPRNDRLVAHVIGAELAPQTTAGIQRFSSFAASQSWVRVTANYKMDADGYITLTESQKNLATGEVKEAKSFNYGIVMNQGINYTIACGFNNANHDGVNGYNSYYFDNIKVTAPFMDDGDYKAYCAEDTNSVYSTTSEVYVELPFASVNPSELISNVVVTDSADSEVATEVSTELVDGIQVLTIVPVDGLVDEEIYTVSMGDALDVNGNRYADIKFVAIPDWNPYDPENPAEITVDLGEDLANVPFGTEGTITMADATFGDYTTNYYSVVSSNEDVIAISDADGSAYTATVVGAGTAYITVKNLLAPAEPEVVYEITSLGVKTTYEITFIDGENETVVPVGEGWNVTAPAPAGQEGAVFAGWAYDAEGAEIADLKSITSDATVYAIYGESVEVSFKSNDPELGSVDVESVQVVKGYKMTEFPVATATSISKFVAWEDSEGNRYTNDELAALTFDSDTSFYAIFVKTVIDIDKDYDFTTITTDELIELGNQFTNIYGGSASLDSEKGLHYTSTTEFKMYVDTIDSGIYVLEVDYYKDAGSGGANIEMKTLEANGTNGNLQGVYPVGYIHTRESINSNGPVNLPNMPVSNETYHNLKFYFDFDNDVYYVVNDGIAGVTYSEPLLLNAKNLKYINFYTQTGMYYQRIALKKLDSLAVSTITVEQPELGSAVVGKGNSTTYTIPADAKTHIYCVPVEGVSFDGWTATGGTIEDATSNQTFIVPGGEEVTVTAATSQIYVTFKFEESDYVTFTEETADLAEQTFKWGDKPAGAPELVVAEGYEFAGWKYRNADGFLNSTILSTDTIVGSRANGTSTWVPIVYETVSMETSYDAVEAQLGQSIEVPVDVTVSKDNTSGYITITYDATALEYVGGTVAEELETEVYFKKIADGEIRAIIDTEDTVTFDGILGTLKFKALTVGETALSVAFNTSLVEAAESVVYEYDSATDLGTITITELMGDVNLDAKINVYDAIAIMRHVSGIETLADDALAVADVDGVEGVAVTDATAILKYVARLIVNF